MRDLTVTAIVLVGLLMTLRQPFVGILLWIWLALMNPHRLAYGFAYSLPFAEVVGLTTLGAWLLSRERKALPINRTTALLLYYIVWVSFTSLIALKGDVAWLGWTKFIKVQLSNLLIIVLITTRGRVTAVCWAISLSLGYFGIRNGLHAALTGATGRVAGPPGTDLGDNNDFGAASVMFLPVACYLFMETKNIYLRMGLLGALVLGGLSTLATYSRGAFLGMCAVGINLWRQSRHKISIAAVLALAVFGVLNFMPPEWFARIHSIENYEEDQSATGRFDAWWHAIHVAEARPFTGGGFGTFSESVFDRYSPGVQWRAPHSIYFQTLGDQGIPGLFLFLAILASAFADTRWLKKRGRADPNLKWAYNLGSMLQLSFIGYAVSGAFCNFGYLDFYYMLVGLASAARTLISGENEPIKLRAAEQQQPPSGRTMRPLVSPAPSVRGSTFGSGGRDAHLNRKRRSRAASADPGRGA
jgi:probable O-glycosylation ligase (exosortase A-associated)